jgi:hypothetical protein
MEIHEYFNMYSAQMLFGILRTKDRGFVSALARGGLQASGPQ